MKFVRTCILIVVCLSCLCLPSCRSAQPTHAPSAAHPLIYLVLGFDEAAECTDVMFLVTFDPQTPRISVLQLPRDTYIASGYAQNKLNQVFATRRAMGDTPRDALLYVRDTVRDTFGVTPTATIGVSMTAFRQTVDAVGGVELHLPEDVTLDSEGTEPLTLTAGAHHIDGTLAERFVRYRRGYARGDLGRMDAQKVFLSAFFHTVRERIGVKELLTLSDVLSDSYISDAGTLSLVTTAVQYLPALKQTTIQYATLPGEAVQGPTGLWYYVVNRKSAAQLLQSMAAADAPFDPQQRLTRAGDAVFDNIYYDDRFSYRVYEDGELSHLHVPRT